MTTPLETINRNCSIESFLNQADGLPEDRTQIVRNYLQQQYDASDAELGDTLVPVNFLDLIAGTQGSVPDHAALMWLPTFESCLEAQHDGRCYAAASCSGRLIMQRFRDELVTMEME